MSRNGPQKREKLKQEYKQHFRKMRDAKNQFRQARRQRNIVDVLKDMNSTELMESFDSFLFEVQDKVARAEARLDVALESVDDDSESFSDKPETDEISEQTNVKESLQQVKHEMGLLYSELERQARQIDAEKTVGKNRDESKLSN